MSENRKNYFFWNRQGFEDAVRRRVCAMCDDRNPEGSCRNPDAHGCALFRYLPELVAVAQHMDKPDVELYVRLVRENVQMQCHNPDPAAKCSFRDTLDCGLEHFLPLVFEAIMEEDALLEARRGFGDKGYE
jgi:hypothetical protein